MDNQQTESEYCRAQAAEARAIAKTETLPGLREVLLASADSWTYLAELADQAAAPPKLTVRAHMVSRPIARPRAT